MAALGALLLLPQAAGASGLPGPIGDTTHFILDQTPYHRADQGGGPIMPGVNMPDVPQQSLLNNGFIRLTRDVDFTLNLIETLPDEDDTSGATTLNALRYNYTYEIGWNGTVHGMNVPSYFDEYGCGEQQMYEEDCDLMRNDNGDVRIFFVIYSTRWDVDGTCCDATPIGQLPVVLGGFEEASFMTGAGSYSEVSGPMLATDAVAAGMLGSNPPLFQVDTGVGVKFHLPEFTEGDPKAIFDVDWLLAEDGNDLYGMTDDTVIQQQIAAYVYYVPEPVTGLLLLSGLVGLTLAGRRKH